MRKFIIKILLFLSPVLFVGIILEVSLRNIPNDYIVKKKYLDANASEISTLILGSSHSYAGINPVYFSKNTFNASHSSQTLGYDYEILKMYEDRFDSLKNIIIPVSYFTLYSNMALEAESWRKKNYVIYYGMDTAESLRDFSEILSINLGVNFNRLASFYLEKDTALKLSELGWSTGYNFESNKHLEESGQKSAFRHTKEDINSEEYIKLLNDNIAILDSIVEWCNIRNIEVVMFTPPAYASYRKCLNADQLNTTIEAASIIAFEHDNCIYLNMLNDSLFQSIDFSDADHLSDTGAKKLSLFLEYTISNLD